MDHRNKKIYSFYSDITNVQDLINFSDNHLLNINEFHHLKVGRCINQNNIFMKEKIDLDKIDSVFYRKKDEYEYAIVFRYDYREFMYIRIYQNRGGYIYSSKDINAFIALFEYNIKENAQMILNYLAEEGETNAPPPSLIRYYSRRVDEFIAHLNNKNNNIWIDKNANHIRETIYIILLKECLFNNNINLLNVFINYDNLNQSVENFNYTYDLPIKNVEIF